MKEILCRLRSPVVIIQILSIITGTIIFFIPEKTEAVNIISTAVIAIINLIAGLNNPCDKSKF